MNIFVAKLSSTTTSEDLQKLFEDYGDVESAKVIMDRETGKSKQFGFVEMPNEEEALLALERLDETELNGAKIVVKRANPRPDKPQRSGGNNPQQRRRFQGRH
ncbi:MAG: RNA-binding protein [Marinilabiliaceae bacterium]|nr:RNA-binding protein [Marinilabiliaceae bacterium]